MVKVYRVTIGRYVLDILEKHHCFQYGWSCERVTSLQRIAILTQRCVTVNLSLNIPSSPHSKNHYSTNLSSCLSFVHMSHTLKVISPPVGHVSQTFMYSTVHISKIDRRCCCKHVQIKLVHCRNDHQKSVAKMKLWKLCVFCISDTGPSVIL